MNRNIEHSSFPVKTLSSLSSLKPTNGEKHKMLCLDVRPIHNRHKIVREATKHLPYKNNALKVLESIINCSNEEGLCNASQATLARRSNISDRSVRTIISLLEKDGIVTSRKRGWQTTNDIWIVPILKLINKAEDFSYDLNNHKTKHREINIIHYNEYECHFANSGKKSGAKAKPEQESPVETKKAPPPDTKLTSDPIQEGQKTDSILLSEWDAKKLGLETEVEQVLEREIPNEYHELAKLTTKRLKLDAKTKISLLREVGQCTKRFVVSNIGGLLVTRARNIMNKGKPVQLSLPQIDWTTKKDLQDQAHDLAMREIKNMGIPDPRSKINADFDEIREFDGLCASLTQKHLGELISSHHRPSEKMKETHTHQYSGWQERAYQ